ncbi:MAG TPA: plastocyanin/azurin family copper-binding protein, partial [Nitrosopumilaceae archaeon]|nr:plastocyanin/azurin family copper-binding protein [Nitrosopumilaceae archaeon]
TSMESRQIKFGDYFPYSKFSDVTDSLNYGQRNTFQKHGQYFLIEDYESSIPTLIGEINQPIQVQLRLLQADDPTKIQHLNFYTNLNKETGAFIIFDKEKPLQVVDPNGIFKSIKVNTSLEDAWFWVIFDIVFEKPIPKSDIVLEAWNERRNVSNLRVVDAWKIIEPDNFGEKVLDVTLTAQVEITHDASSPICKQENSCYIPAEAKILEGGHVIWTNLDSFIHTITSGIPQFGPDNKFDEMLMPGESIQIKFDQSGVYRYYCIIHPWATGKVNVYEDGQPSAEDETPERELKIKSTRFGGSVLVENNDFVTSNKRILTFDISGHVEDEPGRKRIDITLTKPDGTKQKMTAFANNRGYYFLPIIIQNWEGGSYGITAKSNGEPIGSISFFLVDER